MNQKTKIFCAILFSFLFSVQMSLAQSSPSKTYQDFLSARDRSGELAAISQFYSKEKVDQLGKLTASEKAEALAIIKLFAVSEERILKETVTGSKAILEVTGQMKDVNGARIKAKGKIDMVKENGRWKIQQEHWSESS